MRLAAVYAAEPWRWDEFGKEPAKRAMRSLEANLKSYFDWSPTSLWIGYPIDRINAHRTIAA